MIYDSWVVGSLLCVKKVGRKITFDGSLSIIKAATNLHELLARLFVTESQDKFIQTRFRL